MLRNHEIEYRPIQSSSSDQQQIQQITQGTRFGGLSFNSLSCPVFVAYQDHKIVGITCGCKGSGDESHILTLRGTYMLQAADDWQHTNNLLLAFVQWAQDALKVTHYKMREVADLKEIAGATQIIPQTDFEDPSGDDAEIYTPSPVTFPEQKYAYS